MRAPSEKLKILVADDHPVFRAGLVAVISNEPDMQVVGEAQSGREAIARYHELRPDLALLDIQMPEMDGIEAVTEIRRSYSSARLIVLTTYGGDILAKRALKAGAQGYVLKDLVRKELLNTIRVVSAGSKRVSSEVERELANHIGDDGLSARETQVLKLVAQGHTNRRIAAVLGISEETAKGHLKSILGKLGAADRTHAVTLGLKRGIIQL
jgi:DNA-binding NarL/FixJ family response regulator